MAGKSLIGSLRVFLGIDSAELTKGAKTAENSVQSMVENIKSHMAHLAEIFAAKEVLDGFMKINENIDQLGKAAQKIGIPVDQLSKLKYAAELADVPFDELQASIAKFDKGLSQAAATGKGPVAAAFKNMGISIRDAGGHVKDVNALLIETAAKFATHADGANKSALAMGLFGKAGAAMVPLLNEGSKGIEEASKQLENMGGVVTPQAAASSARLIETIKIVKAEFYAVAMQAVILIDNALNPLETSITDLANTKDAIKPWGDYFKGLLIDIDEELIRDAATVKILADAMYLLTVPVKTLGNEWTIFKEKMDAANKSAETQIAVLENLRAGKKALDRDGQAGSGASVTTLNVPKSDFAAFSAVATKATKEHKDAVKELIASLKDQNEEFSKGALQMKIDTELQKVATKATDEQKKTITDLVTLHAKLKAEQGTQLQELQNHLAAIAKTSDLAKNAMTSWFDSALSGTFNLGNALADLAKNIAKMGFEHLLTGLLDSASGHPLYGGGGGGLLAGLGKLLGFASGGSILPNGSGSIDSQVMLFKKRPDEQVDVGTPGQLSAQRGGGGSTTIHIDARGADAGQIAQLRNQLADLTSNLSRTIRGVVTTERRNNPGFV